MLGLALIGIDLRPLIITLLVIGAVVGIGCLSIVNYVSDHVSIAVETK